MPQNIQEMDVPTRGKVPMKEVSFEALREDWNEYRLSDGSTLRAKNVVTRAFVEVDENGDVVYDETGAPTVFIQAHATLVAFSGDTE